MKCAILWCGQVERDKRPRSVENDGPQSKKEKRLIDASSDVLLPFDDFSLQATGLELAYQAARKLGVGAAEIHACLVQPDLRPQELETPVRKATRAELERLLIDLATRTESNHDPLLFIAVNHGSAAGLTTAEDVTDPMRDDEDTILTPSQLETYLQIFEGPQVLVIVTCYAGAFLRLGHENRCVLAACGADERYLVPRCDNMSSPFLNELFGAWCDCAHDDAVPRTTLPLDEAFERAKERMSNVPGLRIPHRAGKTLWPSPEHELIPNQRKPNKKPR